MPKKRFVIYDYRKPGPLSISALHSHKNGAYVYEHHRSWRTLSGIIIRCGRHRLWLYFRRGEIA